MSSNHPALKPVDLARRAAGYQFDRGFVSPYFITNPAAMEAVLERPLILLRETDITTRAEILPLIAMVAKAGRSLLVVAKEMERDGYCIEDNGVEGWKASEAVVAMEDCKARGVASVCAVRVPAYGDRRRATLEDIAIFTGGRIYNGELSVATASMAFASLGTAERVVVRKEHTTVIRGGGDRQAIESRLAQIHAQIAQTQSEYDLEKLQQRFGMLLGGLASMGAPAVRAVAGGTKVPPPLPGSSVGSAVNAVAGATAKAQKLKEQSLRLAHRHPAMPCPLCGARVFQQSGNRCWGCGATLDWSAPLACTKCRKVHRQPVGCCLQCASPLEHAWECSSCHQHVGVSLPVCPACGAERKAPPTQTAAVADNVVCRACGQQTAAGAFCAKCGQPMAAAAVAIACPQCGRQTTAEKFCTHCGSPLPPGTASARPPQGA